MDEQSEVTEYSESASKKDLLAEGACPTCGYHVGGDSTCPRCGARVEKTTPVKLVRKIALLGSLLGIIALWGAAYLKQPPTIQLRDVQETMNNALVRVEGSVGRVRLDESSNNFSLSLEQDQHRLDLRGFNNLHRFQEHFGDDFPKQYDTIRVTGTLNTSVEYGNSIFLSIPERLDVIDSCDREPMDLRDLSDRDIGSCVLVEGQVGEIREFSVGKSINIVKGSLPTPLTIFDWDFENISDDVRQGVTTQGTEVEVFAYVDVYRGNIQLQLIDASDPDAIKIKGAPPAQQDSQQTSPADEVERITTGSVTVDHEGQIYSVYAMVTNVREMDWATVLTIDDQTGPVDILLRDEEAAEIGDFESLKQRGAVFEARVRVGTFRGEPQLEIAGPQTVVVH